MQEQSTSFVEANGMRFAYIEEGMGPLVLLFHGFPDTPQTWSAARPALAAAGYRAVTPYMRGYAPSAIPSDGRYDGTTLGRDVLALIAAFGERRAIVVGHDWGASAAYAAASLEPERIEKLIVMGIPHPASIRPSPWLLWKARHLFSLARAGSEARVRRDDFAHVDALVRRWSPRWKVPDEETRAVKRAFSEPGSLEAALGYYRARKAKLASPVTALATPTVAFAGATDILPAAAYRSAASWFTGGYEVVELPGGHFMHREHPDEFVAALVKALAGPR